MMLILLYLLIFFQARENQEGRLFQINGRAQGTTYSIRYLHQDSIVNRQEVDSIFKAIDLSLSLYQPNSLINLFNRTGKVNMDLHLKRVVEKSMAINQASGGGFDITVKKLVDLWGFGVYGKGHVPTKRSVRKALVHTGSRHLAMDGEILLGKKVEIDCNGIAQGYSVDVIFQFLLSKGIDDLIVEVGGEVRAKGKNSEHQSWKVGLESPSGISGKWYPVNESIELDDRAVTTSGSYRKFFTEKGNTYSHTIDPRTGTPVNNGIVSVTVVAPEAITADGWDNAFYVMGVDTAFKVLKQYPEMELRIIYEDKNGSIRDSSSAGFKKLLLN